MIEYFITIETAKQLAMIERNTKKALKEKTHLFLRI